jgi:hypothetical protein
VTLRRSTSLLRSWPSLIAFGNQTVSSKHV